MTLISHKHKFIFIKTRKTASTTIENLFVEYCLYKDIDKYRNKEYRYCSINDYGVVSVSGNGLNTYKNKLVRNNRNENKDKAPIREHENAYSIKEYLGDNKFNDYFKFTSVRNTYDMMVSRFFWNENRYNELFNIPNKEIIDKFRFFIKNFDFNKNNNYNLYTIDNKPVCNFYINYENMNNDLEKVFNILNIPYDNNILSFKKNYRLKDLKLEDLYDQKTYDIVYNNYCDEIKLFNYEL